MKKILILIFVTILFSCEKKPAEKCWECTEKSNSTIVRTWETCDVLEASHQDGRRWLTGTPAGINIPAGPVTIHTIICKAK